MTHSFKCPSCNAPLEFEGKMMQKCAFCGSNVIVPTGVIQDSSAFGGFGQMNFGDFSELRGKALKIAEIQNLIQAGNKIQAIKVFRETFGVGLKEAKDAVDAMERGESVDISGTRVQTQQFHSMHQQNVEVVKKVGKVVSGTFLFTFIFAACMILGVGIAIFFVVTSAMKQGTNRTFVTNPTPAKSPEKPKLADEILRFGGKGNGAGKFEDNRHVAVDGSGRIYSSDYQGGKIQVFDAGGKYISQWIVDPKMNLYELAADRKGSVYVLNNKGIFVYKGETGELLNKIESYGYNGLALTLDGKVVALKSKEIIIYDGNLKLIQEFKDAGERANTVFGFDAVAVDGDNQIYAVDRHKGDICKFSADGKFLNRFNAKASISPSAIAVDNKGRIYASNVSEINVFDANGNFINAIPENQAFGMAFNDADELFVATRPFVVKYKVNF